MRSLLNPEVFRLLQSTISNLDREDIHLADKYGLTSPIAGYSIEASKSDIPQRNPEPGVKRIRTENNLTTNPPSPTDIEMSGWKDLL